MITWRLDRLLRSGALCGIGAWVLPALMAVVISAAASSIGLLGAFAVALLVIAVAVVSGSSIVMGLGLVVFSAVALVDETGPIGLVLIGSGLYVAMVLHGLAGSMRRAPAVDRIIWTGTATTTAAVVISGAGAFALAYAAATATTWDAAMIPVAFVMFGLTARFAAERHGRHRRPSPDGSPPATPG